ncbi:chorismate mutase [Streptomyces sp. HNM0575]|uniref:chorismate mutase n=1 Tax=Streptomyces sp. HNM0575 TaxID=2716338 RepID=UPI00145CC165|nr:chorismate mutase [Streptomyces sp. HNM0575]NLU72375.1 chorismate mutase [Streptomyces sp. HNM0575]
MNTVNNVNDVEAADAAHAAATSTTAETTRTAHATANPADATESATETGAATGAATGTLARVDDLDARIITLVQERRTVLAGIRQTRVEAGGHGGLAREMEVLDRYRKELGRPGTQLAMTLLALCRGQL